MTERLRDWGDGGIGRMGDGETEGLEILVEWENGRMGEWENGRMREWRDLETKRLSD